MECDISEADRLIDTHLFRPPHGIIRWRQAKAIKSRYNRMADPVRPLPEFESRPELLELTRDNLLSMDQQRFSALFRNSAIKRAKLAGLQRNALSLEPD